MINQILTCLDNNSNTEKYAVVATLYDWKSAFDKQCPKLSLESFKRNGVRPSLLPVLKSYLQNRKMIVKWKGKYSTVRNLNGGGPNGGHLGYLNI